MGRVILRTMVSSPHEAFFVYLNWLELREIVDIFLITEADVTHSGVRREVQFYSSICEEMKSDPKVIYAPIHIDESDIRKESTPENFHANEQKIRDGFRKVFDLEDDDIVISCDADEVLFGNRIKVLLGKTRFGWPFAESYCLRLHQIIYRFRYYWSDCDFRGPTVSKASYFINQSTPQWRYSGRFTLIKSGTHFSWVMSSQDMLKKIKSYAHSAEFEHLANLDSLSAMVRDLKYPFEPDRKFTIKKQKDFKSKIYPKSLRRVYDTIARELIE